MGLEETGEVNTSKSRIKFAPEVIARCFLDGEPAGLAIKVSFNFSFIAASSSEPTSFNTSVKIISNFSSFSDSHIYRASSA